MATKVLDDRRVSRNEQRCYVCWDVVSWHLAR
jgi:hypothetical protein